MQADGTDVLLEDLASRTCWRLDESTRFVAKDVPRFDHAAYAGAAVALTGKGTATKLGEHTIRSVHHTPAGTLTLRFVMEQDRLRVIAEADGTHGVTSLALPGTFRPDDGGFLSVVPSCQGVLHTGKGPAFYKPLSAKGHHDGFTMSMFGQLGDRAALVVIAESDADAVLHWEKTSAGEVRLMWLQHPSMGTLSYDREVVILPSENSVTSVCKCYRHYVIEQGRFRSWEEKLFGAALVFLGYFQDHDCDYAASLRRLRQMGIDKEVVYPMWCRTTCDTKTVMNADSADTRTHAALAEQLGYLPGSFIYIVDGQEGSGDLMLQRDGQPYLAWQINEMKWHNLSADSAAAWAQRFLDHEHSGLQFVHFDVLASRQLAEDFHPAHRADARADREGRRRILEYAGSKGLDVSSEGFFDRLTPYYDLGNSKYPLALGGDEYCVVPMTMLVYHDSAFHTWWEVDNYNNPHHRSQGGRGFWERLPFGGGFARQQACMDALMGTPPDIFPIGRQYCFVPENHPQVYFYRFTLDDPSVQRAIASAKPVMAPNRRIGRRELVEHRLHRADGALQETVFADGTRVVVNFANVALEAPGVGLLAAESWKTFE